MQAHTADPPDLGLLGFAAARETIIGEITGAQCPSCKKADFREYCKRPTTRKGGTQRYPCNACATSSRRRRSSDISIAIPRNNCRFMLAGTVR